MTAILRELNSSALAVPQDGKSASMNSRQGMEMAEMARTATSAQADVVLIRPIIGSRPDLIVN